MPWSDLIVEESKRIVTVGEAIGSGGANAVHHEIASVVHEAAGATYDPAAYYPSLMTDALDNPASSSHSARDEDHELYAGHIGPIPATGKTTDTYEYRVWYASWRYYFAWSHPDWWGDPSGYGYYWGPEPDWLLTLTQGVDWIDHPVTGDAVAFEDTDFQEQQVDVTGMQWHQYVSASPDESFYQPCRVYRRRLDGDYDNPNVHTEDYTSGLDPVCAEYLTDVDPGFSTYHGPESLHQHLPVGSTMDFSLEFTTQTQRDQQIVRDSSSAKYAAITVIGESIYNRTLDPAWYPDEPVEVQGNRSYIFSPRLIDNDHVVSAQILCPPYRYYIPDELPTPTITGVGTRTPLRVTQTERRVPRVTQAGRFT